MELERPLQIKLSFSLSHQLQLSFFVRFSCIVILRENREKLGLEKKMKPSCSITESMKLDRKTVERNRRIHMKALCFELASLVPSQYHKPSKSKVLSLSLSVFLTPCSRTAAFDFAELLLKSIF